MKISDLDIPDSVKEFYTATGVTELYPPQMTAVELGLLEDKNILAAVPTASGKTMIAELAMLKSILKGGKCLYIVPLRALASEKYERFKEFKVLDVKTGISSGDFDSKDEWLARTDIIVATSEKADSLIRNGAPWMRDITIIVVDEIHLLDSPDRGPTLEVTIARLMQMNPDAQIIGLSATIGNAREMARWLNANLVESQWRPVDLKEGVFFSSVIHFPGSQRSVDAQYPDDLINLAADTLKEGGQCLIFESSRRNAEASARRMGQLLRSKLDGDTLDSLGEIARGIADSADTDLTKRLAECIRSGTAFHHAGLLSEQRKLVEDGFRGNVIKIVSSTPTLAAGLNLPARRVIIRGFKRYDANYGMVPIPVLEYKQMAGRAGRPGMDPYGESVLIARSPDEMDELLEHYVLNDPEDIWSKLASEKALRSHILSAVSMGFASSREELMDFLERTFFAHQQDTWKLNAVVDEVLIFLEDNEMLTDKNGIYPTPLGELVSRLYVDPMSASIMVNGIRQLDTIEMTEFTLLHLICRTPDMRPLYLRAKDEVLLSELVSQHSGQFLYPPAPSSSEYEWFLSEVKTAALLFEWISEKKEDAITDKFNVGPGDIRAQAETAEWMMHSLSRICALLHSGHSEYARDLAERISYGASKELLPIIKIRGIGRVRARKLYNAGLSDIEAVRTAGFKKLSRILGPKIAENTLRYLGIDIDNDR